MPVLIAKFTQISGTSTPSRSRHTMTGFCMKSPMESRDARPSRAGAAGLFLTEIPPDFIQGLLEEFSAGPFFHLLGLMSGGPVDGQRERDEPGRSPGQLRPEQA